MRVASGLINLGGVPAARNNFSAAEPLYRRALALKERALGAEHVEVGEVAIKLAAALEAGGTPREAGHLYRRALAIEEHASGPAHPDLIATLEKLGSLREGARDYAEAERFCARALAIAEKAYGGEPCQVI